MNQFFFKKCFYDKNLDKIFLENKLTIVDIGATGFDKNNRFNVFFKNFKNIQIFKFDEIDRIKSDDEKDVLINSFLWSEENLKKFYITKNLVGSSFFKLNDDLLKEYLNYEENKIIEIKEKKLQKLDNIKDIKDIDFLKIDSEGSEFEILKGADKKISSILGLEIEQQYLQRYKFSPKFFEISKLLDDKDFELYLIYNERWKKNNFKFNVSSNYKLVWGDFIYFLSYEGLKTMILNSKLKENILFKYLALLMMYNLYDEALNTIKKLEYDKVFPQDVANKYRKFVLKNHKSNLEVITKSFFKFLYSILVLFLTIITWKYKKSGIDYFKISLRGFLLQLSNLFGFTSVKNSIHHDLYF